MALRPGRHGLLWVAPEWTERLVAIGPTYANLEDATAGLDAVPAAGAARHDTLSQSLESAVAAATAFVLLATTGWDEVHERAATLAERSPGAGRARPRGRAARPHDARLVDGPRPAGRRTRGCTAAGVIIRDLPGRGLLRASVGAWNDESDLQRLLAAL